jgi:hypothetical protein
LCNAGAGVPSPCHGPRAGFALVVVTDATVVDVVVVLDAVVVVGRTVVRGGRVTGAVVAAAPPHDASASAHAPAASHLEVGRTPRCLPTRAGNEGRRFAALVEF